MARDKKTLIESEFHIKVTRSQTWEEETEGTAYGKDKPEKSTRETHDTAEIIDVVVNDLDIKKFIRLIYSLGKD